MQRKRLHKASQSRSVKKLGKELKLTKKEERKAIQIVERIMPVPRKAAKRRAATGLTKPMQPSGELAAIVGSKPLPRTQVTKKIWDHIKKNKLQDPKNKGMINADDKLRPIFGGKKHVSLFEMTKIVNKHLK